MESAQRRGPADTPAQREALLARSVHRGAVGLCLLLAALPLSAWALWAAAFGLPRFPSSAALASAVGLSAWPALAAVPSAVWPALAALLGAALLGAASYSLLRLMPLAALKQVMTALAEEQARNRLELSQYVDVLFQQAIDGIAVIDARGVVRSCNPKAAQMFGVEPGAIYGKPLSLWLKPPEGGTAERPFPVGQCESVARRQQGKVLGSFPCELSISRLTEGEGGGWFVAMLRDISDRRVAAQRLEHMANFDSLTGLPNRVLFRDRLAQAMRRAERSQRSMALMFLDLDRFKVVNDSLGHQTGDRLLQHVAQVLTQGLRAGDSLARDAEGKSSVTVSRLGGDEFTVIAEDLAGAEQAAAIAQRVLAALEAPFVADGTEIVPTASVGVTLYPQDHCPLDDLLKHADMAMYRAKELGRNGFQFYSDAMNIEAERRLQLEGRMRHALERDEFRLIYQPKASLVTGEITGVEALLRWQRDPKSLISPEVFIGVLEDSGLILSVGHWVLEQAAAQVCAWQRAGLPAFRLAVNVSARQLRQADFVEGVAAVLQRCGLPPHQLELELTESMLMDGQAHVAILKRLGALGVQVAIDDFGTGYSSLSYLKRFSVDTLKIDRSFVQDTPDDPEDSAITAAVIALGRSLNLRVVAEGVETVAQANFLRAQGCDEMQGYLLSKPMPPPVFVTWWREREARRQALRAPPPAVAAVEEG